MPRRLPSLLAATIALLVSVGPVAAGSTALPGSRSGPAAAVEPPALSNAKVVIIVGPTHSETSHYRSIADDIYNTAIQYSSNVTRIYSPNATWDVVKPALQGANIVVYLGHGNGWPSPYTYDPLLKTKDGMGLNAAAGKGDANTKYYGEPYLANEIHLAAGAVVFLNHLCYASGNSEPGNPAPTLGQAMQRVDNYGAGFLAAGAGAVIAEGHGSINGMLSSLFTRQATLYDIWTQQWSANGNAFAFQSSRNPGVGAFMDPDSPSGGYYRSLVGDPNITSADVTGRALVPTTGDPDTVAPELWHLDATPARLVVGAGTFTFGAELSEPATWTVSVSRNGTTFASASGTDDSPTLAWDGTVAGSPAASGRYTWTLSATDGAGNVMADVSRTFLVWDGAGTQYVPVTPGRVLDTRFGSGMVGAFVSGVPRTFRVAGIAGVPSDAVAVTGNVTVVGQSSAGWLSVTPDAVAMPSTSTINFPIGDTRANGLTVPLSETGALSAVFRGRSGATTHLIFDVTGYFAPRPSGATYVPLTPARLLDTRFGTGLSGTFATGTPRTLLVAGQGGVPAEAIAITGNVTVTRQTSAGWLGVTPTPVAFPPTSNLNFPKGDNRANNFTVPLNSDGTISATFRGQPGSTTDLIIDVTGYFVASSAGASYVPIAPTRVLDTRFKTGLPSAFASNTARTFGVEGQGGVPSGILGITGNVTVVGQSEAGWLAVTPTADDMPPTSTLNFPRSDNRANGVVLLLGDGGLSAVYRAGGGAYTHLILDVTGYFVSPS